MRDFLFTPAGKVYLQEEYVEKERSTYDIADERRTYANLVRRALVFHRLKLRDKPNAQKAALKKGRHPHPTKGRTRSEEERARISEGVSEVWKERKTFLTREGEEDANSSRTDP
jgi:hypothetical protein